MIRVVSVEYLDGYRLALRFSDGTTGVADMSERVKRPPFERLQDKVAFADVHIDGHTVCWGEDLDIAPEAIYALAHSLPHPETFEQVEHNELEMSLREFRRMAGVTQSDAAEEMGMAQSELSRFERRDDRMVSTLRRYVEALGGKLEVTAVLGDKRIALRGV